jgi:hypothetical protein
VRAGILDFVPRARRHCFSSRRGRATPSRHQARRHFTSRSGRATHRQRMLSEECFLVFIFPVIIISSSPQPPLVPLLRPHACLRLCSAHTHAYAEFVLFELAFTFPFSPAPRVTGSRASENQT